MNEPHVRQVITTSPDPSPSAPAGGPAAGAAPMAQPAPSPTADTADATLLGTYATDLPEWDLLPPGQLLVRRPARDT